MSADEYGGLGKTSKNVVKHFRGQILFNFFTLSLWKLFRLTASIHILHFFAKEESSKKIFWIGETFGNGVGGVPRRDNGRLPTNWKR